MQVLTQLTGYGAHRAGGYSANAVSFDGTNDYIRRAADLTSNANGGRGIVYFQFQMQGGDGARQKFYDAGNELFTIERTAANKILIHLWNTAISAKRIDMLSTSTYTNDGAWHWLVASWDFTSTRTGTIHMYIDDADEKNDSGSGTGTDGGYTQSDHVIGARESVFDNKLFADLSDFYLNTEEYLDLSTASNRRLFADASDKPVDLGATGSTPTGADPRMCFINPTATWHTNVGDGGGFTEVGALTEASTSPSD